MIILLNGKVHNKKTNRKYKNQRLNHKTFPLIEKFSVLFSNLSNQSYKSVE